MTQFLHMGGYAGFVWPSYGVTLLAVLLNIGWALRLLSRSKSEARRRLAMQEAGE
jgi:heme exporter protein CcmD